MSVLRLLHEGRASRRFPLTTQVLQEQVLQEKDWRPAGVKRRQEELAGVLRGTWAG